MIKNKIGYLFFIVILTMGCDDYLDINESPNGAAIPPINGLLANVTYNTAINTFSIGSTTSFYVQYLASPNEASATDIYERIDTSGSWGDIYNILSDIYDMERFAQEDNAAHFTGIAKTLTAINLGMAVDVWGNVPYSEAFSFETITPTFDDQQELYGVIISLLDEALVELNKENVGQAISADSDFIHGGDIEAWKKTANALKARYLIRAPASASEIRAALGNAYDSNADDAQLSVFQVENPWGRIARRNAGLILGGWLSEQFIDALNGTTFGVFDPRLPLITSPLPDGTYEGTVNGEGRKGDGTIQAETFLTEDGYYSSESSPLFIITYPELKFIEAETEFRDGNPDAAYNAYLEGIQAHMEKLGVDSADITTYISNPEVAVGAGNISLDDIFKEKYVATFLNPEAWVDARRYNYGYQDFTVPTNNALGNDFIARFDYPDTEYQRNRNNVPEVDLLTSIWWDTN